MTFSTRALITIAVAFFFTACNKDVSSSTNRSAPAPTTASSSPSPDQYAAARANYAKRCAVCHGDTGEGKTVEVEGKKIKAPPLRSGHALKHPDSDFVKQIVKGGDGMPAFGDKLSAKEIDDLVAFIRHDFQGGAQPQMSPMKMK